MNKRKLVIMRMLIALAAAAVIGTVAQAQPGAYELSWWTADGGGGQAVSGGDFTLNNTIGQPDAGRASGGDFTLTTGFQTEAASYLVFAPLLQR